MIQELSPHPDATEPPRFADADHPMRRITREVAFSSRWDAERAREVADLFNSMAADWSADHVEATKAAPIHDAIERGDVSVDGLWVEIGSGTGAGAIALRGRVDRHLSFDLALEMLRHAPAWSARAQADAVALPLPDRTADVVLLINMLLVPAEVDRVLSDNGSLVWVSTLGDQTPIYLAPDDVAAALPGSWQGATARAGTGRWTALRRA